MAPFIFPESVNGETFKVYIEKILAPQLKADDTVLVDNLSSHKISGIDQILEQAEATLKPLPRYSPDVSPIEQTISKLNNHQLKAGGLRIGGLNRRLKRKRLKPVV